MIAMNAVTVPSGRNAASASHAMPSSKTWRWPTRRPWLPPWAKHRVRNGQHPMPNVAANASPLHVLKTVGKSATMNAVSGVSKMANVLLSAMANVPANGMAVATTAAVIVLKVPHPLQRPRSSALTPLLLPTWQGPNPLPAPTTCKRVPKARTKPLKTAKNASHASAAAVTVMAATGVNVVNALSAATCRLKDRHSSQMLKFQSKICLKPSRRQR